MFRKVLFPLLFLLVLLDVFIARKLFLPPQSPIKAHAAPQKIVVNMNNNKFSPSVVDIKVGDTVVFENTDTKDHWPASNIHPTHAIYPEFDPKKAVMQGESWEFTFNKIGKFRFHDHLNSWVTGEISVTGIEKKENVHLITQAKNQLEVTWSDAHVVFDKMYYRFYPQKLETVLNQVSFNKISKNEKAIAYFLKLLGIQKVGEKLLAETNGGSKGDCHQPAHRIGRIAYEVYGAAAFKGMDTLCHSALIHGAMEAFLKDKGSDNLSYNIETLCQKFDTGFGRYECLHGMGHGVLAYEDYDMSQALTTCKTFTNSYSRESCYGGVFMENIIVSEGNGVVPAHQTKWVSSDPYFPCNGVDQDERVQIQCYMIQTARMLDLNSYNFKKVTEICSKTSEDMRSICFRSLGRDAAGSTLRTATSTNNICTMTPSEYYKDCLRGALFVFIEFWGPLVKDQPHALCKVVDEKDKSYCYRLIGSRLSELFNDNLGSLKKDKMQEICNFSEKEYIKDCLETARLRV